MNNWVPLTSNNNGTWSAVGTVTFCGREYYPLFNRMGCDGPCLTLYKASGGSGLLSFVCPRIGCGRNYVDFATGDPSICLGPLACGGADANVGVLRVAWRHCEYTGAGYYCIRACGSTGDGEVQALADADASDPDIEILAGPYDTEGDAAAACGPIAVTCCVNPIPRTLYIEFGGSLAVLGTVAAHYLRDGIRDIWRTAVLAEDGSPAVADIQCVGALWGIARNLFEPSALPDTCEPLLVNLSSGGDTAQIRETP